jgi:hypothetical protein
MTGKSRIILDAQARQESFPGVRRGLAGDANPYPLDRRIAGSHGSRG